MKKDEPPEDHERRVIRAQTRVSSWWASALNIPRPINCIEYAQKLESLAYNLLEDPAFGCTEGELEVLNSLKNKLQSYRSLVSELAKKCANGKKSPGLNFSELNSLDYRFRYCISEIEARAHQFYGE